MILSLLITILIRLFALPYRFNAKIERAGQILFYGYLVETYRALWARGQHINFLNWCSWGWFLRKDTSF